MGCTGGGDEKYVFGKYTQNENLITLIPKKIRELEYWDEEDPFDYSKPEIKEYEFHKDSMNIKQTYYLLEENKRSYLLSPENKGEYFADDSKTNDFEEYSQMIKDKENYYGDFFTKDTIFFGSLGLDKLPKRYLRLIEK